ncbi:MAG: hypothetical protein ACE5GU_15140 [Candidatus Scalinduaceae bacterium]
MSKKYVTKNTSVITYQLPQPCIAKYIVVVVDRGITVEVDYFDTLKEAKRTFGEMANDYGYEPEEINGSDYYAVVPLGDVSIWEWTEYRYEKIYGY